MKHHSFLSMFFTIQLIFLVHIPTTRPHPTNIHAEPCTRNLVEHLSAFLAAESLEDFCAYPYKLEPNNPIRAKMASHWIRNAASHVFNNDLRSFLELIVNARDAMLPTNKSVGKFGLGFLSILSFLSHQDTQGTAIIIETHPKNGQGYTLTLTKDKPLASWHDGNITFTIQKTSSQAQGESQGTSISIKPNQGTFSPKTLETLYTYVHAMECQHDVQINLSYQEKSDTEEKKLKIGSQKPEISIIVKLTPSLLFVHDNGPGISIENALINLLIPSVSTKTPTSIKSLQAKALTEPVQLPEVKTWHGKENMKNSCFAIIINGIASVQKYLPTPITDKNGKILDIIIHMPQATQLTLARDELSISPYEQSFEELWIKKIIDATIDAATTDASSPQIEILPSLYQGLLAWEEQSALQAIKGKFTAYFKKRLDETLADQPDIVAAPPHHAKQLKQILDYLDPQNAFVLLPLEDDLICNNYTKLEQLIVDGASQSLMSIQNKREQSIKRDGILEKITKGTKLIFIPDTLLYGAIKSFTLRSTLFIPQSFLDKALQEGGSDDQKIRTILFDKMSSFDEYPLLTPYLSAQGDFPIIVSTISSDITWKIGTRPLIDYTAEEFYANQFTPDAWAHFNLENLPHGITHHQSTQNLFKHNNGSTNDIDHCMKNKALYAKFILASLLYRFGITSPSTPGSLYLHMNNQLTPLWPLPQPITHEAIIQLILTLLPYTYGDLRLVALNQELRNTYNPEPCTVAYPYTSPSILSRFLTHSSHRIHNNTYHNPLWTTKEAHAYCTVPGFIGVKGLCRSEMLSMVTKLKEKTHKALSYTLKLQDAVENLSIASSFIDLAKIEQAITSTTPEIANLFDVIYARYDSYFSLSESDLPSVYAGTKKIQAQTPYNDCLTQEAATFMNECASYDYPAMLKLIAYQKEDFLSKTNLDTRAEDLKAYKLYIPSFLNNTPISMLTVLKNKGLSLAVIAALIHKSHCNDELIFIAHLLLSGDTMQKALTNNIDVDDIERLIEQYIQKRVGKEKRKEISLKQRSLDTLQERLETLKDEDATKIVQEYFKLRQESDSFSDVSYDYAAYLKTIPSGTPTFTLKKLMKAHATGSGLASLLKANDLNAVIKKIMETRGTIEGSKIMQCIETGTEKSSMQASVELLQNALDAVKNYCRNGGSRNVQQIKISLGKIVNSNTALSSACLSIKDEVGMAGLENLLADVLIPDYSRKTPENGDIGNMGNGLFHLYKDAEEVLFITRIISDPNKIYLLHVIPLRNNDGLVDDLQLRCAEQEPGATCALSTKFYGTCIAIKFREQTNKTTTMQLLAAKDFIRNCAGATNVATGARKAPTIIMLDHEQINCTTPYLPRLSGQLGFTLYKRANRLFESYITTGGIPFRPLGEFLRDTGLIPLNLIPLINTGLIIDIPVGTYEPVQSRTRLKMSTHAQQKLQASLLELVYWHTLEQATSKTDRLACYFTHLNSHPNDFHQVMLNPEDQAEWTHMHQELQNGKIIPCIDKKFFFTNYTPLLAPYKSFACLISEGYQTLVKSINELAQTAPSQSTYESKISGLFSRWQNTLPNRGTNALIDTVVVPWFEEKLKSIANNTRVDQKNSTAVSTHISDSQIKNQKIFESLWNSLDRQAARIKDILNSYLTSYVQSVYTALNKETAPSIQFYFENSTTTGAYKNRSIKINLKSLHIADLVQHIVTLTDPKNNLIDATSGNSTYRKLFGYALSTGTITHELEHARRNEHDEKGIHTAADIDGKRLEFDACASHFTRQAVANGCLENWRKKLNEASQATGLTQEIMERIIPQLQTLEGIDQELLMRKLGF